MCVQNYTSEISLCLVVHLNHIGPIVSLHRMCVRQNQCLSFGTKTAEIYCHDNIKTIA